MKKSEEQQAKQKTKWNSYSVERGKKIKWKIHFVMGTNESYVWKREKRVWVVGDANVGDYWNVLSIAFE